jgi:hypothetical protein
VVLVLGLVLFGAPLFVGLGHTDLENDEAIYSYSVERMVALHDWLTPRAIYDGADNPFLEKPPLKTWIVTAGQLAGLPADEVGLRFFDPLFAVVAFAYVFALGRRLAGPLCGFVALLMLFTFQPMVFEHGVRTNNMEAALLLTYCAGVYHFLRWTEDVPERRRRHAWFVAAYFAFGFLTKFVAALFLPIILTVAFLWRRGAVADVRTRGREWTWPVAAACAAIAPWFLYQTAIRGLGFWNEILGHQIVTRFTSGLDPNHLRPWHYYFSQTWMAFFDASAAIAAMAGIVCLAERAWRGRPWLARLVFVWWILPYALISAGSSKLFHYAYPFVPPLALGVGLAATVWFDLWNAGIARWSLRASRLPTIAARPWLEIAFVATASILFVVAYSTAIAGPLTWKVFGVRVLRNAGAIRPALAGVAVLALSASMRAALRTAALTLLVVALPVRTYFLETQRLTEMHSPLHATRDCARQQRSGAAQTDGVFGPDWRTGGHSFFYYLRSVGPYRSSSPEADDSIPPRLFEIGRQTPVILEKSRLSRWTDANAETKAEWQSLAGVDLGLYAMALPGPYAACATAATHAGGKMFSFAVDR